MRHLLRYLAILICASVITLTSTMIVAQTSSGTQAKGKPIKGEPIRKAVKTNSTPEVVVTEPAAEPSNVQPAKMTGDFLVVNFEKLANFSFEVPEGIVAGNQTGKSNEQIPADVRALTKKKVALTGFMLPLKVDNGFVSEMLIMKDQSMCCYGAQPRINDWVSVKMNGKGVKSVMDQPVTVFGELRVGEMLENGYLIGIYEMTGEKMEVKQE